MPNSTFFLKDILKMDIFGKICHFYAKLRNHVLKDLFRAQCVRDPRLALNLKMNVQMFAKIDFSKKKVKFLIDLEYDQLARRAFALSMTVGYLSLPEGS